MSIMTVKNEIFFYTKLKYLFIYLQFIRRRCQCLRLYNVE